MKRIFAVIIAIVLSITTFVTPASAYSLPDLSRRGSITIEMKYGSNVIRDMGITIYRVAEAELLSGVLLSFSSTSQFSGANINYDELDSSSKNLEFSKILRDYASNNNIVGTKDSTNSAGQVAFSNLDIGIYLVVPSAITGYYTPAPYLIMLPQASDNGWVYSVSAKPKTEVIPVPPPPPPPPGPPPRPRPDPGPEPDPRPRPDPDPRPTPTPLPPVPTPPRGSYEEILPDDIPLGNEEIWTIDPDDIPKGTGDLPQTGVLRWPIPVLSISGLLLFSFGWVMTSKEKKSDEE